MKKNENYPKYVQAMRMMDEGHSVHHVAKVLHIGTNTIKLIRRRYLYGGELALLQPKYQPHLDVEKKAMILTDIDKNRLSLSAASIKYNIHEHTLRRWMNTYRRNGVVGLMRRCSQSSMKKKRQRTDAELDELEMLRKRNEYLEAENALLKKVKALVEEREARLHAIGRGPSKN